MNRRNKPIFVSADVENDESVHQIRRAKNVRPHSGETRPFRLLGRFETTPQAASSPLGLPPKIRATSSLK